MASIDEVIEGLQILKKYTEKYPFVEAQHDIIYSPVSNEASINEADGARLDELGWHQDSESGCWARFT